MALRTIHLDSSVFHMDTTNFTKSVAESVSNRMGAANESILSLATKTGIPYSTLRRRVLGTSPFTVQELAEIATVLGLEPQDLIAA